VTIEEFDQLLSRTLDADCRLLCTRHDPPRREDVEGVGRVLGVALPDDYIAFQTRYGASWLEAKEEAWPRPKLYSAGPYWSFLYACIVFGIGPDVPEILDIRAEADRFASDLGTMTPFPLVPLFRWQGSADRICVARAGKLYDVSHETPDQPAAIELPFLDFLAAQVTTLVKNKTRLRAEVPRIFMTEADHQAERAAAAAKDAALTERRCPECGSPCPSYRSKCKVCGFAIGRPA
jgi:hypothetical protein